MLSALTVAFTFIQSLVGVVSSYFTAKVSADATKYTAATGATATMVSAGVAAEAEYAKVQAANMAGEREWPVTRWMKPCVFYPCALHFGAIMVDSTFKFGWGIPKPPEPYGGYEGYILLSVVIMMGGKDIVLSGIRRIWK